jgi:hypothetical protein
MKKLITIVFVVLGLSSSVQADPITILITSGSFGGLGYGSRASGGGSSTSGFSFAGGGTSFSGLWGPEICLQPVCAAGSTIEVPVSFGGLGFPGIVTYNGVTYETGRMSGLPIAWVDATWTGSLSIPAGFTGGTLTAPFTFSGAFFYQDVSGSGQVNLIGSGRISAEMVPRGGGSGLGGPPLFLIGDIAYTFGEEDIAPTPEPGTWLLIGTGAALVARQRRKPHGSAE